MSHDQFKKLDAFMQEHRPELKPATSFKHKLKSAKGIFGTSLVTLGIATLITWNVINHQKQERQAIDEFTEVMLWDATADDMPADLAEDLEIIE